MEQKFVEIRDKGTFVPALAIRLSGDDHYLARRAGFGSPPGGPEERLVILVLLSTMKCEYDPYAWGGRTYPVAHNWLQEHFDEHENGGVVDVEFILGESEAPKRSEAERGPA